MKTKIPEVYAWIENRDGEEIHRIDSIHALIALKRYAKLTTVEHHDLVESNKMLICDLVKREKQLKEALKEIYELKKEISKLKNDW